MINTEIGLLGVSTKWNALSAASGSEPALTVPRTEGSASVYGANEMDADAFAAMLASIVSIVRPSISSVTGTRGAAAELRFMTPTLTVMRSWPENSARPNVSDGIETLVLSPSPTDTGRQRHVLAEPDVLGAGPARLLEVGDQDRLAAW